MHLFIIFSFFPYVGQHVCTVKTFVFYMLSTTKTLVNPRNLLVLTKFEQIVDTSKNKRTLVSTFLPA